MYIFAVFFQILCKNASSTFLPSNNVLTPLFRLKNYHSNSRLINTLRVSKECFHKSSNIVFIPIILLELLYHHNFGSPPCQLRIDMGCSSRTSVRGVWLYRILLPQIRFECFAFDTSVSDDPEDEWAAIAVGHLPDPSSSDPEQIGWEICKWYADPPYRAGTET